MFRTWRRNTSAVALAASVGVFGGLAVRAGAEPEAKPAGQSTATPADAPKSKGIEEITVTGRRREEKLQSTPLSPRPSSRVSSSSSRLAPSTTCSSRAASA